MGQLLLFHQNPLAGAAPGSSLVQLREVPGARLARQRRGVDGAPLEDLVYDVLPRLLVLVPQQRVHKRV